MDSGVRPSGMLNRESTGLIESEHFLRVIRMFGLNAYLIPMRINKCITVHAKEKTQVKRQMINFDQAFINLETHVRQNGTDMVGNIITLNEKILI